MFDNWGSSAEEFSIDCLAETIGDFEVYVLALSLFFSDEELSFITSNF